MSPRTIGVNEHTVTTMFDFTEPMSESLVVCRLPRSMRRGDLPFWTKTRDDGVRQVWPDPPTRS